MGRRMRRGREEFQGEESLKAPVFSEHSEHDMREKVFQSCIV